MPRWIPVEETVVGMLWNPTWWPTRVLIGDSSPSMADSLGSGGLGSSSAVSLYYSSPRIDPVRNAVSSSEPTSLQRSSLPTQRARRTDSHTETVCVCVCVYTATHTHTHTVGSIQFHIKCHVGLLNFFHPEWCLVYSQRRLQINERSEISRTIAFYYIIIIKKKKKKDLHNFWIENVELFQMYSLHSCSLSEIFYHDV